MKTKCELINEILALAPHTKQSILWRGTREELEKILDEIRQEVKQDDTL